jgi:hypothetical protein
METGMLIGRWQRLPRFIALDAIDPGGSSLLRVADSQTKGPFPVPYPA